MERKASTTTTMLRNIMKTGKIDFHLSALDWKHFNALSSAEHFNSAGRKIYEYICYVLLASCFKIVRSLFISLVFY